MKINLIFNFLVILFQTVAGMFVLFSMFKIRDKKKLTLSFSIFLLLMTMSSYIIPKQFRSFFTIFSLIFISICILKICFKEAFVAGIINVFVVAVIEIILSSIFLIFGINKQVLQENFYFTMIINITSSLLIILLCLVRFFRLSINKLKNYIVSHNKLIICLFLVFFIVYLLIAKNMLFSKFSIEVMVNFLILCAFLYMFILLFVFDVKNNNLEIENQQMLNYVTKYEKIIAEQGKANHEFKNQLMVIRGYAQMKSDKLIEYIDSIVEDIRKAHSSYLISQLNKFPDGGIKGLLYYKLSIMNDEKISYEINVESGVKSKLNSLSTTMYKNVTKILGVLLDNAIDASKKSKSKEIIINVVYKKDKVEFTICNTYKGKIDLTNIGNGYTTKGKGHGYGLRLVRDIINSNNIFGLKNDLDNKFFVSKFTITVKK